MSNEKNKRIRSIGPELLNELSEGSLKAFVDFVRDKQNNKTDDNLALCFRGSGETDVVSIYKYNTKMWDLLVSKVNGPKATITLNFGRFTEQWENDLKILFELGFRPIGRDYDARSFENIKSNLIKSNYSIIDLVYLTRDKTYKEIYRVIETSYKVMSDMLNDYHKEQLDGQKPINYYKKYYFEQNNIKYDNKDIFSKVQNRLEKHTQQEIFMENHTFRNGLFIYDLEFHQPKLEFNHLDLDNNDYLKNEPDMFGIYYDEHGMPKSICMVEVKSTTSALNQDSGLETHRKGMEKYLENEVLMRDRIEEAKEIMNHYAELELYGVSKDTVKLLESTELNKSIIFVYTNELTRDTEFKSEEGNKKIREEMDSNGYKSTDIVECDRWCKYNSGSSDPFAYMKEVDK